VRALAIETATTACAIALEFDGAVTQRVLDTGRRHTEALTAGVAAALAERGASARELELVAVDRGPGLFTGLRVGLAAAQAIAAGVGAGLVPVSSLELLAHGARRLGERGEVLALVDARRGELFAQRFDLADEPVELGAPRVLAPRELAEEISREAGVLSLVGDGAVRYGELLGAAGARVIELVVPPSREALVIARRREAVDRVSPLYLREADAVAHFEVQPGR
jgi:tRNA threonylcarbamoyladenosine biosynthesis protein TsaB